MFPRPSAENAAPRDLQTAVARLRALAAAGPDDRALQDLEAAERRMSEAAFKLVVLGEYKRGKSTLINALLRAPALPMGILPLTSIVTEVCYGEEPGARVELLDGRSIPVRPEELPTYVTEPGNPRNEKGVRRAIVFNDAPLLKRGVTIVDTPGIGSIFAHNTAATYDYLDEADAVVIVLAADQQLSAEECRLIRALDDITNRILFVVNRVDVLTAEDAALSLGFIRDTLASLDGGATGLVFPLSARQALAERTGGTGTPSEFERFEQALHGALIDQKSSVLADRSAALARRAADAIALRLRTEREALRLEREELERAIQRLERAAGEVEQRLRHSEQLLRYEVEELHRVELKRRAGEEAARIGGVLWPRIEAALEAHLRSAPPHRVAEVAPAVGEWAVEEVRHYYRGTEPLVQQRLQRALEWHQQRVQAAAGEIVALANDLLGSVHAYAPVELVPERPRFHLRDWDYSGGQLRGSTWMLWLPRRWAVPTARQLLRELMERRISQNMEAIRYDWSLRLDEAVRQFQRSSREQVLDFAGVITAALRRSRELRDTSDAPARAASLDREIEQVAELGRQLSARVGS